MKARALFLGAYGLLIFALNQIGDSILTIKVLLSLWVILGILGVGGYLLIRRDLNYAFTSLFLSFFPPILTQWVFEAFEPQKINDPTLAVIYKLVGFIGLVTLAWIGGELNLRPVISKFLRRY